MKSLLLNSKSFDSTLVATTTTAAFLNEKKKPLFLPVNFLAARRTRTTTEEKLHINHFFSFHNKKSFEILVW